MIIRRWFAPRSKEFSTIVERVICNSSPLPSYYERHEKQTDEGTRRIGSFYESHPVPSLSAQLEIDFAEFASRRQARRAGPFAKDVT